jgi:type 1 glutamine amidotransferase
MLICLMALTASLTLRAAATEPFQDGQIKTLLLTGGPVHDAKAIGDIVLDALEQSGKFQVTRVHEDLDALLPDRIAPFKLVVFYWTLGEINDQQKRGLLNHIAQGNGYVTFHSGADSFRGDPEYRALVGGYFVTHPHYREYQVSVTQQESPITREISEFMITDEQYILDYDPRVTVLANALYQGRPMPVLWTKDWGQGRVFYSALGHDPKACQQEMFQQLLIRGALWAAGSQ